MVGMGSCALIVPTMIAANARPMTHAPARVAIVMCTVVSLLLPAATHEASRAPPRPVVEYRPSNADPYPNSGDLGLC